MHSDVNLAFAALADPTSRAIVARLAEGQVTVMELAKPFDISLPAISRHLRVLERANLISQERHGQFRRCRLNPDGLKSAAEWLDFYRELWSESFDRLDEHLRGSTKTRGKSHGTGGRSRKR